MYSLGLAAQRSDDLETAHRWLERCISECVALAPPDAHAVELIRLCQAVLPPRANVSLPPLHQMIDLYWADASGTFLQGWAHAEWLPVEAITIGNGRSSVTAERHDREDLLGFWPGEPEVVRGGFRAYLPGPPHSSVTITAHTRLGPIALSAELPDHPLPSAPEGASLLSIRERIAAIVEAAPSGPVLAIGVRAKTQESLEAQLSHFVGREVIGLDIHSGIGVDRVGDAHALDEMFSKDQFAIVYSASLLEHVAAPWLVAAQCASVTAPGGVNIHQAPWVWPTHSAPNDFWRFSPEGLEQLFSPAIGFRVLFSAGYGEATVTPHGEWREQSLAMPTLYSGASSWIAAEKVANPSAAVSWPSSTETNIETARRYPIDGIADLGGTT